MARSSSRLYDDTRSIYSRAHLSAAWSAVLIGSALPELVLGFRYPLALLHWLSITKAALLVLLLLLTVFFRMMIPLRALVTVLLTLHVQEALPAGPPARCGQWRGRRRLVGGPDQRVGATVRHGG